jgi:voltage-gated potassium channel
MDLTSLDIDSKFTKRIIWNVLIFVAILWTAVEAPYSFVMDLPSKESSMWWDGIISSIFVIDVVLRLMGKLSIKQEEVSGFPGLKLETKPYHKTLWFPLEVLSCIPFEIICGLFGLPHYLRLIKVVRLLRAGTVMKLIRTLDTLALLPKGFKLGSMALGALMFLHWITCGWMLIYPEPLTDAMSFYIKANYWALTTLTTIGYGDITPTTNGGRIFTMFIMVTGVAMYGFIIGNVSRMLMLADRRKEAQKEKMGELSFLMKHYRVPMGLQKQVFSYYHHLLSNRFLDEESKVLSELPPALQNELQVYMKMKLISNIPIFEGCKVVALKMIASALQQNFYTPNSHIIKSGDSGEEMFIIGHGAVDIYINDNLVTSLKEGQFFGEIALLEETTRSADVKAKSYCDLYSLHKDEFLAIVEKFPDVGERVRSIYQRRKSDSPRNKRTISREVTEGFKKAG